MTTVTIIGAGNMARGIGMRLRAAGADVQILAPSTEHATELAAELGGSVSGGNAGDAYAGEMVVLAVWYAAALQVVEGRGRDLQGKVVVDITNPVNTETFDGLVTPPGSSAAEEIAQRLPGVAVVKAFNTTFAGTLVDGEVAGQPLDVLIAGDDTAAKASLVRLVEGGGMRPVDVGPLRRAQQLEALGFLHMAVQDKLGTNYGSAVKFLG
jgi:predicted dinucleotide-binding enzyme